VTQASTTHVAERYIGLLGGDDQARRALLACSAALRLDDEVAMEAISLVAQSNGSTGKLLGEIKGLACVWRQWDGTWYLAEEVRSYLADRFEAEVAPPIRKNLRELLAAHADRRAPTFSPDGPLTAGRARATKIESAYQKTLTQGRAEEGGRDFGNVWSEAAGSAKSATCDAVAYLSVELDRRVKRLPDEVIFLRGMSAYQRGNRQDARRDFEAVYTNGRFGEIYATAAHLFGRLVRDPRTAERAFRDSLAWNSDPFHQAQVWHSLGNLLSKDRNRWAEAEDAYRKSLGLDPSPEGRAQVWHSLGNLLSKDRNRWAEAEDAYRKSLDSLHQPEHEAQVWHSLGLLLTNQKKLAAAEEAYGHSFDLSDPTWRGRVRASWADALVKLGRSEAYDRVEAYALEAQRLDPDGLKTRGVASRVLADLYEKRGDREKAISALKTLLETNRALGHEKYQVKIRERIDRLQNEAASSTRLKA